MLTPLMVADSFHPDLRRAARRLPRAGIGPRTYRPMRLLGSVQTKITARDELAFQLQSYPMLDDRTATRTDLDERQFRMWNNKANRFGWQFYTGHPPGSDEVSGLAAPARTDDLSGLPPTWIGVGTLELFYEEDVAYATRLRDAGVACELEEVPGAFHGFDSIQPKAGVTEAFRAAQVAALGAALGRN